MAVNLDRLHLGTAALRSGQYREGEGSLHCVTTGTWCCLGVLCRVAQLNGLDITTGRSNAETFETFDGSDAYLPDSVRDWYGFDANDPVLVLRDEIVRATYANDEIRAPFGEIADAFDASYAGGGR